MARNWESPNPAGDYMKHHSTRIHEMSHETRSSQRTRFESKCQHIVLSLKTVLQERQKKKMLLTNKNSTCKVNEIWSPNGKFLLAIILLNLGKLQTMHYIF